MGVWGHFGPLAFLARHPLPPQNLLTPQTPSSRNLPWAHPPASSGQGLTAGHGSGQGTGSTLKARPVEGPESASRAQLAASGPGCPGLALRALCRQWTEVEAGELLCGHPLPFCTAQDPARGVRPRAGRQGHWGAGRGGPTYLDTPGQGPAQKVVLTRASQPWCRSTVLCTRTRQESGQRKGGGGGGVSAALTQWSWPLRVGL